MRPPAVLRRALLPGAHLGLFLPLLATREPASFFRLLPPCLAAAWLLAAAFLFLMGKLLSRRGLGPAADPDAVLAPLIWLNLSFIVFIVPVPAIPFFVGAAVAGVIWHRLFVRLGQSGLSPAGLERAGLVFPFLASFFLLFQVNIIHDAFQYLCVLVSLAMDRDLNFYNEAYLMNANRFYNPFAAHSARYLGVPLLEGPFFAAGHLLAHALRLFGSFHQQNGMSHPYLLMTSLASAAYGLGALILTYLLCREFFPRRLSLLATMGCWLASPLTFFSFSWNGWPHPFNVFFMTLFLLYWQRTRGRKTFWDWMALGLIGGILLLLRPINGYLALFPLWEMAEAARETGRIRPRTLAGPLLGGIVAMAIFSPQLTIWKCISGSFWSGPYREIGDYFDWLHPDFHGTLLATAQHGLFPWSPLLLPAAVGLVFFLRLDKVFGWLAIVIILIHTYVYSSWSVWWTGIGFSNRFFTELCPILTLGLAALIGKLEEKSRLRGEFTAAVLALFGLWNFFLIGEYRSNLIPYGIPDPGRVRDEPLTLAAIVKRHLFDFPDRVSGLFADQWSNENFFLSRLLHALTFRQARQGLLILAAFLLAALSLWLLARILLSRKTGAALRRRVPALTALTLAAVVLLHLFILYAQGRTIPFGHFYHFDSMDVPVSHPAEDVYFYSTHREPVSSVDILTYLVYGHSIKQGTPLAVVSIYDADGRSFDYTFRAGLDSAENSFPRPEFIKNIRHRLEKTTVIREGLKTAYSRHLYPVVTCLRTLDLPEPLVVQKIRVRYLLDMGELVVSDIFMRDF